MAAATEALNGSELPISTVAAAGVIATDVTPPAGLGPVIDPFPPPPHPASERSNPAASHRFVNPSCLRLKVHGYMGLHRSMGLWRWCSIPVTDGRAFHEPMDP